MAKQVKLVALLSAQRYFSWKSEIIRNLNTPYGVQLRMKQGGQLNARSIVVAFQSAHQPPLNIANKKLRNANEVQQFVTLMIRNEFL